MTVKVVNDPFEIGVVEDRFGLGQAEQQGTAAEVVDLTGDAFRIVVTDRYTDPTQIPPPIFPDIPYLGVETIPDAGRGVYYYDIYVEPGYNGPRGQLVEIPIAFAANEAPAHFQIPPAQLALEDESGRVYHTYGPAQTLVLTDSLPSYVKLTGATMAVQAEVDALSGANTDAERAAIFTGFDRAIPYTVDEQGIASFLLPGDALDSLYDPAGDHRLFVVAAGVISPPTAGPNWANYGARLSYEDQFGLIGHDTGQPYLVEAHGAILAVNYACREVITGVQLSEMGLAATADPSTCALEAGANNQAVLQATIRNNGDYPALGVTTTLNLPPGVVVLTTTPQASQITTGTVSWQLGDLGPGGYRDIYLDILTEVDESGLIRASSIQAYAQVIDYTYGRFVDSFSQREIGGQLAGDYNLPVQKAQAFVYLPLLLKEADHRPDLVVEELVATHEAITVVIKNNGPGPVVDGFWVDVYIDPVEPPVLNRHWWEIAEQGLVWGITSPLPAGESLILTIGDSYYAEPHSDFTGTLPAGASIWAQVDSVNPATAYGGVQEHNEDNNLTGPIQAGTETAGISLSGDSLPSGSTISLPPRRLAGQ